MAKQKKDHVRLDMVSSSLHDQGNHLRASLDDDNPISTSLSATTSSSTCVYMNF
jgi:hypothetical protein